MMIDPVPPLIAAQLNYLIANSPFPIKVEQMWGGGQNPRQCVFDRFTIAFPFCLDIIKWDVIYNAVHPLMAPDVIFGPEDERFRPYDSTDIAGEKKNALTDWNCKDPSRLLSLILELRELYMAYQRNKVAEVGDERLKFEFSTMLPREGIECFLTSVLEKPEEVKFSIPLLDLDLNKMIMGSTWKHQQKIYLQAIFPVGRKYSAPRLKLVSSPEFKSVFSVEDFRLPSWVDGMCTAEYLPNLEAMLVTQIKDAVSSIETRRKFIMALARHLGRPLEADPVFCRKASFLAQSGLFSFMVHISIPLQFPKQRPSMMLQSTQHFNAKNVPIKSLPMTDYPWSPRWELSEMAERMFDFVVEECLSFKKYCNEAVLQQR